MFLKFFGTSALKNIISIPILFSKRRRISKKNGSKKSKEGSKEGSTKEEDNKEKSIVFSVS